MGSSPKIYASNSTSSTAQRGVEAKEIEIANARLDVNNISTMSQLGADSSRRESDECVPLEDTGSYLQVLVEKHRRKQERAAVAVQTSTRLPSSSSPVTVVAHQTGAHVCGGCGAFGAGDGEPVVWAAPVLVSRTALPALRLADTHYSCPRCGDASWKEGKRAQRDSASEEHVKRASDARPLVAATGASGGEKQKWNIFKHLNNENLCDEGPECVEVYRFEHGSGEYLASCGGARPSRCEQAARRGARLSAAALAHLLAAPRALLALPIALLLHVQRCMLEAGREAAAGCALTTSDQVLKPALTVTFNALVQPLLVFARNVAQAARDALRPLALALGDAVEPAARLLHAVRLVHVHIAPHCACVHNPQLPP